MIKVRRSDAERAAAASSRELLATYEAQVVRALHEIDQTLDLVKYWHEDDRRSRKLADLRGASARRSRGRVLHLTAPIRK